MAIGIEVWIDRVQEQLFQKDLAFLGMVSTSHDEYAKNANVNVPQSGGSGTVTKNYAGSYPKTATQRTDTILRYAIDNFETDPTFYTYSEAVQISYDKQVSIISEHTNSLCQSIGSSVLNAWALNSTAGAVYTSGAGTADYLEGAMTGTRKKIALVDIAKLKYKMDLQNVPQNDRYLILPSSMYVDLLSVSQFNNAASGYNFGVVNDVLTGAVLPTIYGFKVIERPTVVAYNGTAGTKLAVSVDGTYTLAAGSELAGLAVQKNFIAKGMEAINVFQGHVADPLFSGGTSLSTQVLLGASRLRSDNKGVIPFIMGA